MMARTIQNHLSKRRLAAIAAAAPLVGMSTTASAFVVTPSSISTSPAAPALVSATTSPSPAFVTTGTQLYQQRNFLTALFGSPDNHVISPVDAQKKMEQDGWKPFVLDVRSPEEHANVKLPMTDKLSPHTGVTADDVPQDGDILVYCKAGVRGQKACDSLVQQGVDADRIYNLEGGLLGWKQQVDPDMKDP